jgi:hypothetical protein
MLVATVPKLEDRIYQWFLKRSGKNESGKVRASGVMGKLCADIANDPVALRKALKHLHSEGRLVFTADQRGEPIGSFITVIRPEVNTPHHADLWKTVLEEADLSQNCMAALHPLYRGLKSNGTKTYVSG